ncbi:MAG: porin [Acidobacteriota bacterium]
MFAKKNLVAAAALLAMAGAAQADVKLYGSLDAGFGTVENAHAKNASTRTTQVTSGSMMTSFIGFAGSEDLGNGLKAEFALESFLANDTGANVPNLANGFWSRASNVALSGNFGKVSLGQTDNPLFTSGYTYNPFGSSMTFSPTMRHFYSTDYAALGFDTGWVNSITYESPIVQGFSGVLQFAPKESTAAGMNNSYAAAVSYNNGPISATLNYEKGGRSTAVGSVTAYRADQKVWDLGASFDFGAAKAFAQYTTVKTSSYYNATGPAVVTDTNGAKATIYQVGVSVPVTDKASVLASYGAAKFKDNVTAAQTDRVFSLGVDYFLSKRTDVYAAFANNTATDLASGQTALLGIKHAF